MPNVTILLSSFEPGGITKTHIELFQELSRTNTVDLACFESRANLGAHTADIEILASGDVKNFLYKLPIALKRYHALKRHLEKKNPSTLICADPSSTLLGWFYSKSHLNFRVIGSCHVPRGLLTLQDKLIVKYLYSKLAYVVAPSVTVANDLITINNRIAVRVIPNMLPVLSCQNTWPSDTKSETKYLFFGRFSSEKNPQHFLKMAHDDPQIKYLLCGEGQQLADLTKLIQAEEINNIEIVNYQPAHGIMPKVELLIVPSKFESFGISAIESWVQGIPVLASAEAEGLVNLMHTLNIHDANLSLEAGINDWVLKAREISSKELVAEISRSVLERFHPSSVIAKWLEIISPRSDDEG